MRVDRRDESLFLFFGNFARGDPYARAGRSIRSLPGRPSFSTLIFKVSLPFFSKFYRSWKLPFFSKFYRSWKLRFHFPVISSALPKFSKNVSSWGSHFFPNFTEAGKPQKFPKMLAAGKSTASYHLLPTSSKKTSRNFQTC